MIEKIQLKNGLSVLLIESHKSPVVSVQMWVQTGSADESQGEEGVSHFIEHLVFKGTRRFGVGEVANAVEGAGGQLNAYTSFDETVFYVTISKAFAEMGLEVISEMMGFPKFESDEIDNEREVVLEEIKRTFDDPHRQASQLLFSTLYKRHPYGRPVIGYEQVIRDVKREDLVRYFQSKYVPSRMTLLVVGDFHSKEMKLKVEKYFNGFKPQKFQPIKRNIEPLQEGLRIQIVDSKFKETLFHVAWPIPHIKHEDIPALEVLSMVLGQGDSSRLNQVLRVERSLVNYVSSGVFASVDPGFFSISSSLNKDRVGKCLDIINKELDRLTKELPMESEISKAIINLQSEEFFSMETVDGLARKSGSYLQLFGDHEYHKEYLRQVQKVTAKDLLRVFRKYVNPEAVNFVMTTQSVSGQEETAIEDWTKEFKKIYEKNNGTLNLMREKSSRRNQIKWTESSLEKGSFEKVELGSGAKLVLKPSYETPIINIKCAFLGGLRAEKKGDGGVTGLLSRVWTAGTQNMDEVNLYQEMDRMASYLDAFGGRNTIGLSMTTLAPFWMSTYRIFEEILTIPRLSESVVEREKSMMLEFIRTRSDKPAQECLRILHENLFKGHPYSRDLYGDETTVHKLNVEGLRHFFSRSQDVKSFCVVISGAIPNRDEVIESFNRVTQLFGEGSVVSDGLEYKYPEKSERLFRESQKEQAHLVLVYPGLTFKDPRRYSLEVIQSLLSGQGGRLFVELRDKASLAYSVSPVRLDGIDVGYFGGYIGCSPDKVETAISMMKEEFCKLAENKVSEEELERAKKYLIGKHDIELQKNSSVSTAVLFDEIYGLPYDEAFHFSERLASVTAEDIPLTGGRDIFSDRVFEFGGASLSLVKTLGQLLSFNFLCEFA